MVKLGISLFREELHETFELDFMFLGWRPRALRGLGHSSSMLGKFDSSFDESTGSVTEYEGVD